MDKKNKWDTIGTVLRSHLCGFSSHFIPSFFILSVFMGFGPRLRCCLISFSIQHLEVIDLGNIHFYGIRYFEPFRSVVFACAQCHGNISTRDETYFKINFSLSSVCLPHIIVNGINRIRLNVNVNTNV